MNAWDKIPRTWQVFQLSATCLARVPAKTEDEARRTLVESSYKGAPVHTWPHLGELRACSREDLVRIHEPQGIVAGVFSDPDL